MPSSIFIVDSSPAVRRMVEQISVPEGFEVQGFQDGPTALTAAKQTSPVLIIADYHLDNMTFSGFCKEVNKLDHLSETYLVSLVNPVDRPDESHLRTLGVRAFLNKPFQPEELLDVIKGLKETPHGSSNGNGLKKRAWPPTSSGADPDEDEADMNVPIMAFVKKEPIMDQPSPAPTAAPAARPATTGGGEDAMKGLFDQLLKSMTERTETRLTELLPEAIEAKLVSHVRPIVQKELESQLSTFLSHENLNELIQPLLSQELPALLKKELPAFEPLIRKTVFTLASTMIKESLDQLVREQVEAGIKKHLSDVVQEHLGTIDGVIKEEIQQATSKQVSLLADAIVRATAEQTIEQAVQRTVPELAEQHIKDELKRLTSGLRFNPAKS